MKKTTFKLDPLQITKPKFKKRRFDRGITQIIKDEHSKRKAEQELAKQISLNQVE